MELSHKDGFCRAPRLEMVAGSDRISSMSFDDMLKLSKVSNEEESAMKIVRAAINK